MNMTGDGRIVFHVVSYVNLLGKILFFLIGDSAKLLLASRFTLYTNLDVLFSLY